VFARDYKPAQILVADNWAYDMKNNIDRKDGGTFLGRGAYKFGAQVGCIHSSGSFVAEWLPLNQALYEGQHMALFQLLPDKDGAVTSDDTSSNLLLNSNCSTQDRIGSIVSRPP